MGDIFLKLLNMSITAGWFILAVLCIRLIFRQNPKWVNCLLWGVAAIRLICPFSMESQFSILPSAEPIKSSTVVEGEAQNYIPSIDSHLTIVENTINPMLAETFAYNESESAAPLQVVTYAAGIVWFCGMILLLICAMGSMIRLHILVREAVCTKKYIYICDTIRSPFILGIIRPRVYLSSALSETEMNYIIAHESAHLKRKDHWWKPLGYLLLCVYWFNPLCWMAYAMFCKDIELACDEKVARDMTLHEKKEYAKVLLSCAMQRNLVMACPLAFGEVGVKERVKSVLNYKKPALWIMITATVVCVILAICLLTNPTKEDLTEEDKDVSEDRVEMKTASVEESMESILSSEQTLDEEAVAQQQTFIDMQVSNNLTGSGLTTLSMEDAAILHAILESGEWEEGTADCINNCNLLFDGNTVRYHSDCGTFNDSVHDQHIKLSEEDKVEVNAVLEKYISLQSEEILTEKYSIQDILLYEQPEADMVCLKVQPSMVREHTFYYYIPIDDDQKWLSEQVRTLDLEGKPWKRRWEGHKEKGWQIVYNDIEIRAFEGGYLYYTYDDEKGMMECFIEAPKLCDYIQIMLMEKAGYQNYDVSDIKDIVSAKLDVNSIFTGWQSYSQTITDTETLQKFEEWFCNAKYMFGGTDCGNRCACLELTLASGDVVKLSMATDSCPNFSIDGVAYDYRPMSDWNNSEFYKCFDEIPWEY